MAKERKKATLTDIERLVQFFEGFDEPKHAERGCTPAQRAIKVMQRQQVEIIGLNRVLSAHQASAKEMYQIGFSHGVADMKEFGTDGDGTGRACSWAALKGVSQSALAKGRFLVDGELFYDSRGKLIDPSRVSMSVRCEDDLA